jgi:hypothetical protein
MTPKERIRSILTDIRFWIILFFIIRLIGITNAPLEMGHNWRQTLTNMIARNFLEGSANLLYPQIDMAGNQSGIIGSEFPFFNYLIYLVSSVFNYSHWYGRLINLIVSSVGIYYFFLLLKKLFDKKIAFNATIVLLASVWFGFSRKSMPDTFSVAIVIIGLYYCYEYVTKGSLVRILLFFLFVTLGMLCKIPALSLLSLVGLIIIVKEILPKRKLVVLIVSSISISVVCIWYFYWVPYLVETYHFQLYFTKGIFEGFVEIVPLLPDFFEKFYFSSLCSYTALAFLIAGLFFIFKGDNLYLKTGVIIVTVSFFIFILKTGAVFPTHSYYIISFTPVMAFIAGYGLSRLPAKYMYVLLILISAEGIGNQQHDFFIKDSERYKLSLEDLTNSYIGKNDLIVINGGPSPQEIYFAHRKGWTIDNAQLNKKDLNRLMNSGATFLIINKNLFSSEMDFYRKIHSDQNYDIYKLEKRF